MPSPRLYRKETERSRSFNGRGAVVEELKRPRTVPNLKATTALQDYDGFVSTRKVLTKVLMNVSIQGSVGTVHVLANLENTIGELILMVVKQYVKEGRRPVISVKDSVDFNLHYSQFTLDCLDREEKLATLGSRNFFMCKRRKEVTVDAGSGGGGCDSGGGATMSSPSCSQQADKATKLGSPCPWLRFMRFLF